MVTVDLPIVFRYKRSHAVFNLKGVVKIEDSSRLNQYAVIINGLTNGSFFGGHL